MPALETPEQYEQAIERTLIQIGRDDIGVGEVAIADDKVVMVTFSRAEHSRTVGVSTTDLGDPVRARIAVTRAIMGLSKVLTRDAIKKRSPKRPRRRTMIRPGRRKPAGTSRRKS